MSLIQEFFRKKALYKRFYIAKKEALKYLYKLSETNHIHSIYLGGSYIRDEIHENSDLDFYIILENDAPLGSYVLSSKNGTIKNGTKIDYHFYSLNELYSNEFYAKHGEAVNRSLSPSQIIKMLKNFKHISGSYIDDKVLSMVISDEIELKHNLDKIHLIISDPRYSLNDKIERIAKLMFHIIHLVEKIEKDESLKFNRKQLLKRLQKDENHILHKCDLIRLNPDKYVNQAEQFFNEITQFLIDVEKMDCLAERNLKKVVSDLQIDKNKPMVVDFKKSHEENLKKVA